MGKIKLITSFLLGTLTTLLVLPWLFMNQANAATFAEKCPDLPTCARAVSALIGDKYVFDSDLTGKIESTTNLELTQENAEVIFTHMLSLMGFTRVPLTSDKTYSIMMQRTARDSVLPVVVSSFKSPPNIPNHWDLMTLKYQGTNSDTLEPIARTLRAFMPANARIIPSELNKTLLVTDFAANLKKNYEMIRDMDIKPSEALKAAWRKREAEGVKAQSDQKKKE